MSDVRVAGTGLTPFGNSPERTSRDLFAEASIAAFEDSGVPREDVEGVFYGNFMGELSEHQGHQGPLMAEAAGVQAPATRYESACASSGTAVREAVTRIRNGENDVLLVGGAERMTNLGTAGATEALAIAADDLWEVRAGVTFPGAYALMARAYFDEFGGEHEDLAHIAVKNHANALSNEKAQYQSAIEVSDALEAPPVSEPLGLYDACPISDGASALVLTSESYAAEHDLEAPVAITGTGQGGDRMALHDREYLARSPAAREAGAEAYADAGVSAGDVDLAEVHDCFTIAEVLALEALDLEPIGEGITAARDGRTTADGETPINLSGGLKAKGHPVGATGASQIAEVTDLLAGEHPNSDHVADATTGVAHNAGGTVASATVHVLEVME
ncbi:Propanoyl-CoA C-acyltransferase [Natrinema pellirubrum DSM 15624]|uniref:Acetyl-CoA acetyltransferase n=2 Tax=Natrinema TaxID=88723 RepID=L0JP56_NATP1|nr:MULTISPECIES: beta-ketoacyl synthase N-terminal-like domain-containing protein [Natrinema]ELZ12883.1 Propanoyl-CoA C-acyltransferase [Natrinema thermotolerans DSM 11552]AGB32643.1 acetyl-CoA acetyltransferase [Natrinema pellirubrum DSM 15624]ELY73778.1 Propanoyl-CoA C-acyltransferase [Natrinema pellirubrum DSM 15624]QCC57906.1 3-ketoacyl-CoA thiolase [Natrinema thermotolerans]WMT08999.1 3-ketoacyl-CoA thiolase [Natrinema thermotolerans]